MDRWTRRFIGRAACLLALFAGPALALAAEDDSLKDKALKLNEVTGTAAMEGQLRILFKDEEGTRKLVATAAKMLKDDPKQFNYTAAFLLARAAHFAKDYEAAQAFYKVASDDAFKVQSSAKIIQVYDGLIDMFIENKKFDDAIKACRDFLQIENPDRASPINRVKPFVMERMIQSLAKKGKLDEAVKLTDELIDADGDGWYFVKLKAEVYREVGEMQQAAEWYEKTLERLRKLRDIDDERRDRFMRAIRYTLSGVYVDLKKVDKAAEELQTLVKKYPDNPTFKNDLGFIWADHDMNLDEAEKLIRQAIEEDRQQRKKIEDLSPDEDKDNPAYLDSLGWVLFKKKNYKEAKKHLEEAVQSKEGQHVEIFDHLADVHMALGEKDQAIKAWEQAVKVDPETLTKRDKDRQAAVQKKLQKVKESKK